MNSPIYTKKIVVGRQIPKPTPPLQDKGRGPYTIDRRRKWAGNGPSIDKDNI
jgi:hypothetical protein